VADKPLSLKELLESAPLYRRAEVKFVGPQGMEAVVTPPELLTLYCDACDHETTWKLASPAEVPEMARYTCKNCTANARDVRFALRWVVERKKEIKRGGPIDYEVKWAEGHVTKYGQYPEIFDRISKPINKRLGEIHAKYYRSAIRLRNFNLGIAALAYMRRVVEDTVNQLLDILINEARVAGAHVDLPELERVKTGKVFEKKIEFAKALVPKRLMHGGHNPLDKLHAVASEGIHALSDEECVAVFDSARAVFEYFFENLPEQQKAEEGFGKALSDLGQKP
jgi:hypothetical protein